MSSVSERLKALRRRIEEKNKPRIIPKDPEIISEVPKIAKNIEESKELEKEKNEEKMPETISKEDPDKIDPKLQEEVKKDEAKELEKVNKSLENVKLSDKKMEPSKDYKEKYRKYKGLYKNTLNEHKMLNKKFQDYLTNESKIPKKRGRKKGRGDKLRDLVKAHNQKNPDNKIPTHDSYSNPKYPDRKMKAFRKLTDIEEDLKKKGYDLSDI